MNPPRPTLLRTRGGHESGKVGMVELFFDLIFVFAVTQISHALLAEQTPLGILHAVIILGAVWWGWVYTAWVTNWLDPERMPVRLCLFALMAAGLAMSSAIHGAFHERGLAFAIAYVTLQLGRTGFTLWALRHETQERRRNFQRIFSWLATAGLLWVAGGLAPEGWREGLWIAALIVEFAGPATFFHTPGLGRSRIADWDVDGSHMAERCALFVIIALGESLLVTGATFAQTAWGLEHFAAFFSTFLGTVAMWWLYFHRGAEDAHHRIVNRADPGRQARLAYTYIHILIIAGIIVTAVSDEIVLAHPGHLDEAGTLALIGGPLLYLLGTGFFKKTTSERGNFPLSHMVGLVLLLGLFPSGMGGLVSALTLGMATTGVMIIVAAWEHLSLAYPNPEQDEE
ncbi:low temperature requirement protein A [Acetobacteraceae bacterium H6797]|nr:low temperature requirement protein A [Acetobacteraceae bacterium H6797]